jgi:antitoxin (DNA-binding transcriptional repressor) of toxin-antitoxin stability system
MVAKRVSESELATSLPEFLERARTGERFAIERDGEIIAEVIPSASKPGITARELIARVGNLKFPGEGFGDDLEAIQAEQGFAVCHRGALR